MKLINDNKKYINIIIDGAFCTLERLEKEDYKQFKKEFENIQPDALILYADVEPSADVKYKIGDIVCIIDIVSVETKEYWVKITKVKKGIEYVKLTNKKKTIKYSLNSLPIIKIIKTITQFNSTINAYCTLFNR